MRDEVYSWRVSTEVKTELEREARRRKTSVSRILDLAVREWLNRSGAESDDEEEQKRLQTAALQCFGALTGSNPYRSQNVRQDVRRRLRQRRHHDH